MSDSFDPLKDETHDAPVAPEPGTLSALTHSADGGLHTISHSDSEPRQPLAEPPGFTIVRELGSGGMGVVYEARQVKLNRPVALKVLRGRGSAQDVIRFLNEAEAVAAIKHPNIVQVYESGQHAGGPFMALELLTGGTLAERLQRAGRLDARAAAELVAKLAGAIQAAHDLGVVHRDLKPGNVLFDAAGTPKVTDFGLAKKGGTDLTRTQAVMGTPAYMAPEQARGEAKFVGPAADVWALGAILYECLTGKRAFDADETFAILRKVMDEAPLAPRTHVPGLPRDLELIAMKCLEKAPADRYPSAAALAADLENYLAGRPVSVRPAGPIERLTKWTKRNPVIAGFTAALVFVTLLGFTLVTLATLEAWDRQFDLANSNRELSSTNNDLTKSRDDLARATGELQGMVVNVNTARNDLLKYASDLKDANDASAERGYLSDIALAHQLWKANDLRGMRATLDRCPADRRRWEWHYLNALAEPARESIPTDSVPLALAYSPDGTLLAYLTSRGTLTVHDLGRIQEGRTWCEYILHGLREHSHALAFSTDGKELAFSVGPRTWVLDVSTKRVKELTPRTDDDRIRDPQTVYAALGYSPEGRLLGAYGNDAGQGKEFTFVLRDVVADKTVTTLATGEKPPRNGSLRVGGAAFSPDGDRFAGSVVDSGLYISPDGKGKPETFSAVVKVWRLDTGEIEQSSICGGSLLQQIAFANRRTIGFPLGGQVCEVGPGPRRQFPAQFPGRAGELRAVAFDNNNDLVWLGGDDKFVVAYDRRLGTERFVLRGCPSGVIRLAVSPNGREIAAASGDPTGGPAAIHRFDVGALRADVWRAPTGYDHVSQVTALASDGSQYVVALHATSDRTATRFILRDVAGGPDREIKSLESQAQIAFRPNGIVTAERNRRTREDQISFFDPDGKPSGDGLLFPARPNRGHASMNPLVCYSRVARRLAVLVSGNLRDAGDAGAWAGAAGWVDVVDADTLKTTKECYADLSQVAPVRQVALYPTAVAFDPAGRRLAATFMMVWESENYGRSRINIRGVVVAWNATTGEELFRQITLDPMRAVGFDPQGRVVSAGGGPGGGVLYAWDPETGLREQLFHGHARAILAFAFGPDGRLVTAGDRSVKVWDVASRREVLTLDDFAREVTHVAFTADGKSLVAATGIDPFAVSNRAGVPSAPLPAEVRVFRTSK